MKLAIIAALSQNRVIGKAGALPWYIPEDLRRFKRLTQGHVVLMGRKTFDSLGKPLPNRRNIVISAHAIPGVECYPSLDDALTAIEHEGRVFVIGGGSIYAQLLEKADELYLTIVDSDVDGDTFFPPYEHLLGTRFKLVSSSRGDGYTFLDYAR